MHPFSFGRLGHIAVRIKKVTQGCVMRTRFSRTRPVSDEPIEPTSAKLRRELSSTAQSSHENCAEDIVETKHRILILVVRAVGDCKDLVRLNTSGDELLNRWFGHRLGDQYRKVTSGANSASQIADETAVAFIRLKHCVDGRLGLRRRHGSIGRPPKEIDRLQNSLETNRLRD